jgi:hypothetical protein
MAVDIYATPGTYTFTVPPAVTLITVECIGGGGGGASRNNVGAGGGGGGGAFATSNISVIPGATYSIIVGSGGNPNDDGVDSSFGTTTVVAKGGKGVALNVTTGGLGGTTAASTGTTKYAGGAGRNGSLGNFGGGGGGGAGSTGAGTTATTGTGGAGNSPGGNGGDGGISGLANGVYGSKFGGGGGGSIVISTGTGTGGRGAEGVVILTYTPDKGFTRFYLLS